MAASSKTARVLAAIAALILVATAVFHATGYSSLIDEVGKSSLSSFFRRSLPGIWLFFSWHLLAVACALGWAAVSGFGLARPLLIFLSLLVCADTVFVFSLAGVFAGTVLLALAALCTIIATTLWHPNA